MTTTPSRPFHIGRFLRGAAIIVAWAVLLADGAFLAWIGWAKPDHFDVVPALVAGHISAATLIALTLPTLFEGPGFFRGLALLLVGAALVCVDYFGVEQGATVLRGQIYRQAYAAQADALVAYNVAKADADRLTSQLDMISRRSIFPEDGDVKAQEEKSDALAQARKTMARQDAVAHAAVAWSDSYNRIGAAAFTALNLLLLFALFGHGKPRDIHEAQRPKGGAIRLLPSPKGPKGPSEIRQAAAFADVAEAGRGRKILQAGITREAGISAFQQRAAQRRAAGQ
ncbi:MAG: hypothetical protein GC155_06170 [Alphaproteobacteria bacterium]|nr:hypothetical protein [Alphaproteobacteria bacterium]